MDKILTLYIYWDPRREIFSWQLPFFERPILWYGLFFALGFFLGYTAFCFLARRLFPRANVKQLAEKLSLYVIIGAIVGARLADVLFYQSPSSYVHDPLSILRFWEGGLSSHGGTLGVLIGLWIFCKRKKPAYLSGIMLLDLLAIPALIAGGCIRIGNFFNQEILGVPTKLPWGVIFGHPADGSLPEPRHPVVLYEALFYFGFALLLFFLRKRSFWLREGKTAGFFFTGVFTFRFGVEFLKAHQSEILSPSALFDMGQLLSLPFILLGIFLLNYHSSRFKRH